MAEVTWTSSIVAGLSRGVGRGTKMIVGEFQISDAETITTGLSTIYSVNATPIEATAPTSALKIVETLSVSAGVVTFVARGVTLTEATDANRLLAASTDTNAYVSIVGVVR